MSKKTNIYKLSESEAIERLHEWAEDMEVDTSIEQFDDVVKTLKIPVRKESLIYDAENKSFKYKLFSPIKKADGSEPISIVDIASTTMERKRAIQNYKDSQKVDQALEMIAASTSLEIGFAGRLMDKDITRINAVIMGFLA
jgi:hypothetical protein